MIYNPSAALVTAPAGLKTRRRRRSKWRPKVRTVRRPIQQVVRLGPRSTAEDTQVQTPLATEVIAEEEVPVSDTEFETSAPEDQAQAETEVLDVATSQDEFLELEPENFFQENKRILLLVGGTVVGLTAFFLLTRR